MYTSLTDAVAAVVSLTSTGEALKNDLLRIASNTSIEANGTLTVFYGGDIGDLKTGKQIIPALLIQGADIRVLDKTVAFNLLNSEEYINSVARAFGITDKAIIEKMYQGTFPAEVGNWLFDAADGPWAIASKNFALATTGGSMPFCVESTGVISLRRG